MEALLPCGRILCRNVEIHGCFIPGSLHMGRYVPYFVLLRHYSNRHRRLDGKIVLALSRGRVGIFRQRERILQL